MKDEGRVRRKRVRDERKSEIYLFWKIHKRVSILTWPTRRNEKLYWIEKSVCGKVTSVSLTSQENSITCTKLTKQFV